MAGREACVPSWNEPVVPAQGSDWLALGCMCLAPSDGSKVGFLFYDKATWPLRKKNTGLEVRPLEVMFSLVILPLPQLYIHPSCLEICLLSVPDCPLAVVLIQTFITCHWHSFHSFQTILPDTSLDLLQYTFALPFSIHLSFPAVGISGLRQGCICSALYTGYFLRSSRSWQWLGSNLHFCNMILIMLFSLFCFSKPSVSSLV